jgi:hypothetical protein
MFSAIAEGWRSAANLRPVWHLGDKPGCRNGRNAGFRDSGKEIRTLGSTRGAPFLRRVVSRQLHQQQRVIGEASNPLLMGIADGTGASGQLVGQKGMIDAEPVILGPSAAAADAIRLFTAAASPYGPGRPPMFSAAAPRRGEDAEHLKMAAPDFQEAAEKSLPSRWLKMQKLQANRHFHIYKSFSVNENIEGLVR